MTEPAINKSRMFWNDKYNRPLGASNISIPMENAIGTNQIVGGHTVKKFGYNATVGATLEPIWSSSAATYPYQSSAVIVDMISTGAGAANDVMTTGTGAWEVKISGLDENWDEVSETIEMNGANIVNSVNKYWRVFRMQTLTAGSGGGTSGIIQCKNGADIIATMEPGADQTLMAIWTMPRNHNGMMKSFYVGTTSAKATECWLYVRPFGGVFNVKKILLVNQGSMTYTYSFPELIGEKSDIYIAGKADAGGGIIVAGFDMAYIRYAGTGG